MQIDPDAFDLRYGPLTVDNKITTQNKFKKVKWLEVPQNWKEQIKQEIATQQNLHEQYPKVIMGIQDWCESCDVEDKVQVKIAYKCHNYAVSIIDYVRNKRVLSEEVKLYLTENILRIVNVLSDLDVQHRHRNITPNNLIYDNNSILLTDFGSARTHHYTYSVDPSSNLERKWQQHCWFYCSKQMLEILNNEIDFREQEFERVNSDKNQSKQLYANNDRWALGIILIQMFTNLQQTDKMQEFPALNNKVITDYMKILKQNVHKAIYEAVSQLLKLEKTPKEIYEQFQKDRQIQGTTKESVQLKVIIPKLQLENNSMKQKNYKWKPALVLQDTTVLDSAFFAKIYSSDFQYIYSRNEKISRFQKWRQYTAANFNPFNLPNRFVEKHKTLIKHNSDMKRVIIQREQREISGYTKDNKLHGLGMMMKLDHYGIYEGIFEDGKFLWGAVLELTNEGLITYYVGPYHEDHQRKNGKCYLQWYKEVTKNQFRLTEQHDGIIIVGLFEGQGKRVKYDLQSNGNKVIEKYNGQWKSNKKHGNGDQTYQAVGQEHKYVGYFENDKFNGKGTMYLEKCIYQIGEYINDKPKGLHKLYKKKLEKYAEGVMLMEIQY